MSESLSKQFKAAAGQWSTEKANEWYRKTPYLIGANYVPFNASNQLEMWQADTFDPDRIDLELGWAHEIGMNTMRVFLHDQLWHQDPQGFTARIDKFLQICAKNKISPMFVLFDSVWDPDPQLGPQKPPVAGTHNSRWVQSPGAAVLKDPSRYGMLKDYVHGIIGAFGQDPRVLAWDIWNEPCNINGVNPAYHCQEPQDKIGLMDKLIPEVFAWTREKNPSQPVTCGVWIADWSVHENMHPLYQKQLELSDIISFHNYGSLRDFEQRAGYLTRYNRPLICTETMARPDYEGEETYDDLACTDNTLENISSPNNSIKAIFPKAAQLDIGMMMWGFVRGKTQTNLSWKTWHNPLQEGEEPALWFHDLMQPDGTPYVQAEIETIQKIRITMR
jgi:hypothetical protein